jgi:hypothetical protein
MPAPKRVRHEPTDDWAQLQLLTRFPDQRTYELIRPVVLFGQSAAERAQQTGMPTRTLYRQVDRFDQFGMQGLLTPPKLEKHQRIPTEIRQHLLALQAEYPAFHARELVQICDVRFAHRPSPHTVKRILAEAPVASVATRRYLPYHQISEPAQRRLAVIRLHSEGWLRFVSSKPAGCTAGG